MTTDHQPSTRAAAPAQLSRHLLDAFEREFWAGHHDRSRLLSAPLRVLHQAVHGVEDAAALIEALLLELEASGPRS